MITYRKVVFISLPGITNRQQLTPYGKLDSLIIKAPKPESIKTIWLWIIGPKYGARRFEIPTVFINLMGIPIQEDLLGLDEICIEINSEVEQQITIWEVKEIAT